MTTPQSGILPELPDGSEPEFHWMTRERACNFHPAAPHGFDRNASHSAGRYVCECESWVEPPAPDLYAEGVRAGMERAAQIAQDAFWGAKDTRAHIAAAIREAAKQVKEQE
jgi:hypothetical protein